MAVSDLHAHPASFRDPASRVYQGGGKLLRALGEAAARHHAALAASGFFADWQAAGKVIPTKEASGPAAELLKREGWHMVLEHEMLPMVAYPYEWSFSMLKDAALLHLELQEEAMLAGWTLKDASSFNIQYRGNMPTFIDTPSLEPLAAGVPWLAYRQFCMSFLYPLMLHSYLGIDHAFLLRADLEGITPTQAARLLRGWQRLRPGVLTHVVFPAAVAARAVARGDGGHAPRKQLDTVRLGLVRGVRNLVGKLAPRNEKTTWRDYEQEHSYAVADVAAKREFITAALAGRSLAMVWDLGCNTGMYTRICAKHATTVIAADGDSAAVEVLYRKLREAGEPNNILPLVVNLANPSPAQGWAGREREAFFARAKPDMVLCLALVHHLRMTNGVPLDMILDWLRGLEAEVIIEFVSREDEKVRQLLRAKTETYDDYRLDAFESAVAARFTTVATRELKGGKRKLFHLRPAP